MTNATIVVTPTSTSVHGSALPIVCATVSVGNEYERPNLNVRDVAEVVASTG